VLPIPAVISLILLFGASVAAPLALKGCILSTICSLSQHINWISWRIAKLLWLYHIGRGTERLIPAAISLMLKSVLQLVLRLLYLSALHICLAALFPCHRLILLRQLTEFISWLKFAHGAWYIIYVGLILQVHGCHSSRLLRSRPLRGCPCLFHSQHLFLVSVQVLRCSIKVFDAQLASCLFS